MLSIAMDKQQDGVGVLIEAKKLGFFGKAILIKNTVSRSINPLVKLTPKHGIDDLSSGVIRITHKQNGTSNSSSIRSGLEQNLLRISSNMYRAPKVKGC